MNLTQWTSKHPIQATLFLLASFGGSVAWALLDWPFIPLSICLLALSFIWMSVARAAGVALLLSALLISSGHAREVTPPPIEDGPTPALRAQGGGLIAGGIVLAGGGAAFYFLVKFCKKHFGNVSTNQLPEVSTNSSEGVVWGGSYIDPAFGYCISVASDDLPVISTLVVDVQPGEARIRSISVTTNYGGFASLTTIMQRYGLATNGLSYSSNGVPVSEFAVPLHLTPDHEFVFNAGIPITLELSRDLQVWEPIGSFAVPAGKLTIVDQASGSPSFYRVTTISH